MNMFINSRDVYKANTLITPTQRRERHADSTSRRSHCEIVTKATAITP